MLTWRAHIDGCPFRGLDPGRATRIAAAQVDARRGVGVEVVVQGVEQVLLDRGKRLIREAKDADQAHRNSGATRGRGPGPPQTATK